MTPHDAFMQSIIESPADDTPRLVYADWLEEHAEAERAEFIRVQCKLWPLRETGRLHAVVCACGLCRLRLRERELLKRHARRWSDLGVRCNYEGKFLRGFVAEITLSCSAFREHRERLLRAAPLERVTLSDKSPTFHATDGHVHGSSRWYRMDESGYSSSYILPQELFDSLRDATTHAFSNTPDPEWKEYNSPDLAIDALSRACLAPRKNSSICSS